MKKVSQMDISKVDFQTQLVHTYSIIAYLTQKVMRASEKTECPRDHLKKGRTRKDSHLLNCGAQKVFTIPHAEILKIFGDNILEHKLLYGNLFLFIM